MVGYCISNERAIYFFLEGTGWKTLHKDDYDVFVEFMEYAFIKELLEETNLMPYHELIVTRWPDAASNESPSVLSFMSQPKYDFWPHAYPNGRKSFVSFYDGDPANPGAPQYYPLWNSAYDKRDSGEVTDLEFYPGSGQTIGHAFVGLGDGEVKMLTLEQGTE